MKNQISLNIGDEIGFAVLGTDIDEKDRIVYFPVVEITTRDGEQAYKYQFPNGEISRSAIRRSDLKYMTVKINVRSSEATADYESGRLMICLNDRKAEFKKALKRGMSNEFEVFPDWEKDSFVVVNKTNKSEYRVNLKGTPEGRTLSDCECKDYEFKKHLCKHIAEVIVEIFCGALPHRPRKSTLKT